MRNIILSFILFLSVSSCFAYTLEGQVFGPDGKAIPDALIVIIDNRRVEYGRDYSNSRGEYRISGLRKGTFLLEVTKFGYPKLSTPIHISGPSRQSTIYHDIHLRKSSFQKSLNKGQLSELYLSDKIKIPTRAVVYFNRGKKYYDKGKYEKAKKKFRKAIQIFPDFSRAYYYLGVIQVNSEGFSDQTLQLFKKAIDSNPNDPFPHIFLGEYYLNHEKYNLSEKHLRQAVALDPALAKAHLLLGETLYHLGNLDEAEFELSQGMLRQPQLGKQFRITLANVYIKLNRLSDARDQLQLFLKENPYSPNSKEIKKRLSEIEKSIAIYKLPDME